jgi:tRNA nucleotidyltransferase/poly(A) polymerase
MDDPLRFLRAIRFSVTKGFEPHRDIFIAMQNPEIKEKLMQTVSAERIREEVFKMMKHDTVKSLRLLHHIEEDFIPGFVSMIFGRGLWLKPTFEI